MEATYVRLFETDIRLCGMDSVLDFREEAKRCLLLAEVETHPEVRTILMGMVLGWLTLAKKMNLPTDELVSY
jgi:hypothetical protein